MTKRAFRLSKIGGKKRRRRNVPPPVVAAPRQPKTEPFDLVLDGLKEHQPVEDMQSEAHQLFDAQQFFQLWKSTNAAMFPILQQIFVEAYSALDILSTLEDVLKEHVDAKAEVLDTALQEEISELVRLRVTLSIAEQMFPDEDDYAAIREYLLQPEEQQALKAAKRGSSQSEFIQNMYDMFKGGAFNRGDNDQAIEKFLRTGKPPNSSDAEHPVGTYRRRGT